MYGDTELKMKQGSVVSGNFSVPLLNSLAPPGDFNLGTVNSTYAQGGETLQADKSIKIMFKGKSGYNVVCTNASTYTAVNRTLKTDSFDTEK